MGTVVGVLGEKEERRVAETSDSVVELLYNTNSSLHNLDGTRTWSATSVINFPVVVSCQLETCSAVTRKLVAENQCCSVGRWTTTFELPKTTSDACAWNRHQKYTTKVGSASSLEKRFSRSLAFFFTYVGRTRPWRIESMKGSREDKEGGRQRAVHLTEMDEQPL